MVKTDIPRADEKIAVRAIAADEGPIRLPSHIGVVGRGGDGGAAGVVQAAAPESEVVIDARIGPCIIHGGGIVVMQGAAGEIYGAAVIAEGAGADDQGAAVDEVLVASRQVR